MNSLVENSLPKHLSNQDFSILFLSVDSQLNYYLILEENFQHRTDKTKQTRTEKKKTWEEKKQEKENKITF